MKNSEQPQFVTEMVARIAFRIGLRLNLSIAIVLILSSILIFTSYSYTKMRASVMSAEKSMSQLVSIGDTFQIAKQFESFVDSDVVVGMWLYSYDKRGLIRERSRLRNFPTPIGYNNPALSYHEKNIIILAPYELRSPNGEKIAKLIAATQIPISTYLLIIFYIIVLMCISTIVLTKQFRSVGESVSKPIVDFVKSISSFQRLNQTVMLPDSYPYIEIKEAYLGFQDMLEKLRSVEKSEKEAAIGRVIRQISHDLRAPLGVFESLLYLPDDSKIMGQKLQIQDSLHRMYAMIESVRHADLELMIDAKFCSLNFHGGLSGLMGTASSVNKTLTLSLTDIGQVKVDSLKFERAWVNLVSNAIDCAKSQVVLEVERQGADLVVRVVDDGPGVSDEMLPKLFQRGATHGKSDGTGLGLAYVRQIMQGHGGDVSYRRENGLTIFECRLPDACDADGDIAVKKLV
ncbi:MAG: HAMP domain-containing histidine kinase, partial [Pseudobdellovibrionaceae bacterium]|nr:HAMP domain-containing histidine kinase [Pseudobdellovibrionaceae bacterium]